MELFDIITLAFFTSIFTAFFLQIVFMYTGRKLIERIRDSMEEDDDGEEEEGYGIDFIDAYIEKTDSCLFLYRRDTNEFIAKGSSWEELNKNAIARYPDIMYNVTAEDVKIAKDFKV